MPQKPWWIGTRGEWYLLVQACLFLLSAFGPREFVCIPQWGVQYSRFAFIGGGILFIAGMLIGAAGVINLGKNLTPLPHPKDDSTLIVTGVFRFVRHPIYTGITMMAAGWGMWLRSWPVLIYALLLFVFFDIKSRREERLLGERFPEYAEYRKRVRKLVPFMY